MSVAIRHGVLSILVAPMSRVLDRLPFAGKFLIASLVAMTVCSVLLFNQCRMLHAQISGNEMEHQCVEFAQPLFQLLQSAQTYRGKTQNVLVGSMDLIPQQEAAFKAATEALDKVKALAVLHDADLGANVIATELDAAWKNYMQPRPSDPKAAFELHNQFMYSVLKALDQASDLSTIALDPEAHTYYLGLLDFG